MAIQSNFSHSDTNLGEALTDTLNERIESTVGEFLSNVGRLQAEQQRQVQEFQCSTVASLLSHKVVSEAALILAKRHLNFSCKKDAVDEISAMLWDLKDKFLLLTRNSNANCSPKISASSKRVRLNSDTTSDVELTKISRNVRVNKKRKEQWRKLLHIQQENKRKLEGDIEKEMTDFKKLLRIEWQATSRFYGKEKEKIREFKSKYNIKEAILKREQEACLQALEAKQLEARQKFRESSAPDV